MPRREIPFPPDWIQIPADQVAAHTFRGAFEQCPQILEPVMALDGNYYMAEATAAALSRAIPARRRAIEEAPRVPLDRSAFRS